MGVTDGILIRFSSEISEEQKKELIKTFDVELVKTTKIYQKLRVKKGTDALEIANKIYESGMVEFSTPSFVSYSQLHQIFPNDTYFSNQITCNNIGQTFTDGHSGTFDADIDAPEAWEITTGCSDIVVAVLDQGVTANHPDLPNSRQIRLAGSDFVEDDDNPSPGGTAYHGNACAGVIAATINNNQGIAGIAPNCMIMPIRIYNDDSEGVTEELKADAIELAVDNGADILSNSWGYRTSNQNAHPVIVAAINYALDSNRVVIFSAGNNADHDANRSGFVTFPANVSGVITVGASDRNDNQANYSPSSGLIDIVAPSHRAYPDGITGETLEMWSIDIPDSAGYNPYPSDAVAHPPSTGETLPSTGTNNLAYTARFGGTSHSCPVVAGVAALTLSINPDLSYTDVFNILTSTADEVGGFTYTNGKCNAMGYGRVNAYEALKAVYPISGPSYVCSSGASFELEYTDTTITWSTSSNIAMVSAQGANPCVFESNTTLAGVGWIEAKIPTDCDSIVLNKEVVVNPPLSSDIEITVYEGYNLIPEYSGVWFLEPNTTYHIYMDYDNPLGCSLSNIDFDLPASFTIYSDNGDDVLFRTPATEDGYSFSLEAQTCCGVTQELRSGYLLVGVEYLLAFSPNPSSGETTVSLVDKSGETNEMVEWDMEVYDMGYSLKAKKDKIKGSRQTLNVSGWQKGVYIVRAKVGERIITGRLAVE